LKRIGSDSYRFFSPAEVLNLIMSKEVLVGGFRPAFEAGAHSRPHLFIGGAMNSFASPDDPIFWLHHTMVDKVWTMWQDCHNLMDPANIGEKIFKPDQVDVDLAYAPGITTRSVWSTQQLGYTYETDIMSAYTFLNTCNWLTLKPNPAIDLNLPPPPMPDLPPEIRQIPPTGPGGSTQGDVSAVPADAAAAAAAAPQFSRKEQKQKQNLRGKSKSHNEAVAVAAPGEAAPAAETVEVPQEGQFVPSKEWAAGQAAAAPFAPHGKGLIVEEHRIFSSCMAAVARKEPGVTRADCLEAVLKRDCDNLGYICDLPKDYREGMNMAADEDLFKKDNICARSCGSGKKE
jgi:hypothetical protein